jgi:hypothetical protein
MQHTISLLSLAWLTTALVAFAQEKPDLIIFDEDDAVGAGYYDASVGLKTAPSTLTLGGPGDKMLILTNLPYSGEHSGLLEWRSAPEGSWRLFVARPGFRTVNAEGYSNLVMHVNGPRAIAQANLPRLGLESSPPDVQSPLLNLGDFLPEGVDSDTNTWQQITIPLEAIPPRTGFSLSKVKAVFFTQGAPDETLHTIWLDNLRIVAGNGGETNGIPPVAPVRVVTRSGDRSVVLHWAPNKEGNLAGYHVYRTTDPSEPLARITSAPVPIQSFADLQVTNGQSYFYSVRAVNTRQQESPGSGLIESIPLPFANDDEFLEYLQYTAFAYFWYEANPANGLIRDRSDPVSTASIAAVGFGLTALGIGIDRGWISRADGAERVLTTLRTFWEKPQGPQLTGTIGHNGWFYHFLDMETGLRAGTTELSSIDTALLLAGVLYAREYFDGMDLDEVEIRNLANLLFNRVDWHWMANGMSSLSHGWRPETGFIPNRWIGYNEAMILYLLGLGAEVNPLPPAHWETWTSGYNWRTSYGREFVHFPPLFGHQYSHCWVDFRRNTDAYMREKGLTYFENSRRATLAQRDYCIANPGGFAGYSSNVWGLTACDGPGFAPYNAYIARGAPPPENDDGTIAPTAAGGSIPFTPEHSLPTLRHFYDQFRTNIWTGYGFRDAFNLTANWWGPHVLGIDQGPILVMAENFRSGRVWKTFMKSPEIKRGLAAAGFEKGAFLRSRIQQGETPDSFALSWTAPAQGTFAVEYSSNLTHWLMSPSTPMGNLIPGGEPNRQFTWLDAGPPATLSPPAHAPWRFYRVFELPARAE